MDKIKLIINSSPENESFSRSVVGAFASRLNPTLDEISDIKTAVSEAVTNSIVHGYKNNSDKEICICCEIYGNTLQVTIQDYGVGIEDIKKAMKDYYTSKPEEERSGLGFTIMNSFMDSLYVKSEVNKGTTVTMKKNIK